MDPQLVKLISEFVTVVKGLVQEVGLLRQQLAKVERSLDKLNEVPGE